MPRDPVDVCHSDCVTLLRSPFGYLAGLLVVLIGWTGATVVAAGAWDPIREANVTPVTEKPAEAAGSTLAVYTDIPQPERQITCRADRDEQTTEIPQANISVVTEVDGTEWHLVAVLADGLDDVTVSCTPRDKQVDNATYAYAVVDGFTSRARTAELIALGGLAAGVAVAGATFWTRRNAKKQESQS